MKYAYFDAFSGLSGDMILGALLDLGVDQGFFKDKMATLNLPVNIQIQETKRSALRALKVNVKVNTKKTTSRKWVDIEALIQQSFFSSSVQKKALAVFKQLFQVEAHVHGEKFHEIHLHEAGADDAIIDVVGTCFLAEALKISKIYSSPLNLGAGRTKAVHGSLPVPPPAVAEILKGVPVFSQGPKQELVTPTGAAIISTLAKEFISFPELCYQKVGCGAGKHDLENFPNILRLFYGDTSGFNPFKKIYQVEANIDDSNPQILAGFLDKALQLGAVDVFLTPIVMKKNRLASKLTVLAEASKLDSLIEAIYTETSSIGVRYYPVERRILKRQSMKIKVLGEEVRIKIAYFKENEANVSPEFSDCLKLSKKKQIPVKKIIELALKTYAEKNCKPIEDIE
jgi:hypothetical protein